VKLAPILRKTGLVPSDGDPVAAVAWLDGRGKLRRIRASYADGWTVLLHLHVRGGCSVKSSFRMTMTKPGVGA
jgi:hypothetical protein